MKEYYIYIFFNQSNRYGTALAHAQMPHYSLETRPNDENQIS